MIKWSILNSYYFQLSKIRIRAIGDIKKINER